MPNKWKSKLTSGSFSGKQVSSLKLEWILPTVPHAFLIIFFHNNFVPDGFSEPLRKGLFFLISEGIYLHMHVHELTFLGYDY